jgi:hypothetical protein
MKQLLKLTALFLALLFFVPISSKAQTETAGGLSREVISQIQKSFKMDER